MKYNTVKKVYSIQKYINDMDEANGIRLDYPLQRAAGQWNNEQKSNLIRTILEDCEIPEIKIASQINPDTGIETKWLIDGKQRLSTIREFRYDGFALGKKTRFSKITYQTYEYETETVHGKTVFKLDQRGRRIPKLDKNGYKIPIETTVDIKGLRYSTLPPELQDLFDNYQIEAKIILDATDVLIQKELRDMNSGSQMNSEQIGMNCLGTELATEVNYLAHHPFVMDYCGFTDRDKIKAKHLRSVYEALIILYYPDQWKTSCEDMSSYLALHLTMEQVNEFKIMLDELYNIFSHNTSLNSPEIRNFIKNKEFFIVMDNYYNFLDLNIPTELYGNFFFDWVTKLQYEVIESSDDDETEADSYASVSSFHTKNKAVVKCRQEIMYKALEAYFNEYAKVDDNELLELDFIFDENSIKEIENNINEHAYVEDAG